MSNTNQITLTIEPFEYILTLQDSALQIVAKHVDECFIWSTILDDILQEPDTVKMDFNTKKQFIVNLEPEEIFDLFDQYEKKILEKNINITFPKMFKTENEHLCIIIEFQRSFGKQQNDTKWIILNPENISKDVIIFQKFEQFKMKTLHKINEIEHSIANLDSVTTENLTNYKNQFSNDIFELKTLVANEMIKQNKEFDSKLTNLEIKIKTKYNTKIAELQKECTTKYQPKLTTELTNLQTTIVTQCDTKYQPKLTTELSTLQNAIVT